MKKRGKLHSMQGTRKVENRVRESGQFEKEGLERHDKRRGGGKVFDSEQTAPKPLDRDERM